MKLMKPLILATLVLLAGCAHNACSPMMASHDHGCPYKGRLYPICCSSNQTREHCEATAARVAEQLRAQGCE